MARRPREDAPGTAHHVMVRGIDRLPIFLDDADREDFLRRLSRLILELDFRCFAWALMPNHVHLVIRSGRVRISQLMARLGTGYARRFNERHDRVGHVFQNRFRSRCVVDDADLVGLVLYVTRNPLEAGLVADAEALEHFRWCGLGALLGHGSPRPFEAISETLALFAADRQEARQHLRSRLGGPWPVFPPPATRAETTPSQPALVPSLGFDALIRDVCDRYLVRAAAELGLAGAEIARRLGITRAAVSVLLSRKPVGELDDLTF